MKKLLLLALLIGVAYGAWKYLEKIKDATAGRQDSLKPGEKALREMDKEP